MTETRTFDPIPLIAAELNLPPASVRAVAELLAEGGTVPFIARYRKERTGDLDEVQIRAIEERHAYLLDLDRRRQAILASIDEQGALDDPLRARIEAASTKAELEDLYLPFKPRRRTRATAARELGLEPLALRILAQPPDGDPHAEARALVNPDLGLPDEDAALSGARDIVAELVAENPDVRAATRERFFNDGSLAASARDEVKDAGKRTKFEQYYDYAESVASIPSHRFLAIRRGEREDILKVQLLVDEDAALNHILSLVGHDPQSPFADALRAAVTDAYRRLIAPSVETDVRVELKARSDREAVDVFASNLRPILLAPPLGPQSVIGIDPGLRTGCKCVAVSDTGRFLGHVTLYLTSENKRQGARGTLIGFLREHRPMAIAVGNGTGGREAEAFVRDVLKAESLADHVVVVSVNEAGASVYSASDVARDEFPDLDLTLRGAISIARRLQDPLAELVKIEPKAIGVGQYQHDVHQPLLARKLGEVVESCVNHVGVELNTASAPLLSYVAGIGKATAHKIVKHRDDAGAFASRAQLLDVSGVGPRTFEQAAGFLRIRGAAHPLDASAVHPERYPLVERMAADLNVSVDQLVGNRELVATIDPSRYLSDDLGEPTLRDILAELSKPGRDPRDRFEPPKFRDDVQSLSDLKPGMILDGVVTNVTNFGAFVDVGVHQDGLVHISQLAQRFVRDPHEVASPGDQVKVKVLSVDLERKRISLTANLDAPLEGDSNTPRSNDTPRSPDDRPRTRSRRSPDASPSDSNSARSSSGRSSSGGGRSRDGGGRSSSGGGRSRDGGGGRSSGGGRSRDGGGRSSGGRSRDGGGRGRDSGGRGRDSGSGGRSGGSSSGPAETPLTHNPFADLLKD